jgi:hypothetical protein
MDFLRRVSGIYFILALAFALPVSAFDYPLSDTAIRSAFMTGSNGSDDARDLFADYRHEFSAPNSGPYVQSISIETPYKQVATAGATRAIDYHAQEAEQDFAGQALPLLVRVQVKFTSDYPTYPERTKRAAVSTMQPVPNYAHDFNIRVTQGGMPIRPIGKRLYVSRSDRAHNVYGIEGILIEKEYNAARFDASEVMVEVVAPGDQDIQTTFDLGSLR